PLRARFKDLPMSDMKEILLQRMLEDNYDKGHADHRAAYEALHNSIRHDECEDFNVDKAQEETKKKSKQDSPKTLPGSPPSLTTSSSTTFRRIRGFWHNRSVTCIISSPKHTQIRKRF
ncbi:hypothetical protein Tco_0350784, partial [Tanacetum coccineum]